MDDTKIIQLKNIKIHHCLLFLTSIKGLELSYGDTLISIPPNALVFVEKNMLLKARVYCGNYPTVISLDDSTMRLVFNFLLQIFDIKSIECMASRKIYLREAVPEDVYLFDRLKKYVNEDTQIKKSKETMALILPLVLHFLLEFDLNIIRSISCAVKPTATEKVIEIISSDLSKPWKISMISEKMFISEISLRKRLENEGTTFMSILTDARMMYSLKLVTMSDYNINTIAYKVGYNSSSYFIKTFKRHFGLTPRQIAPTLQ
ncbi:helix-turn-helix transcriptional regulator [Salmonella enterica subsp. enterica serovar Chester]|nr:helix-turn-helix transcriptional regulator [Salmonella enterica subsp. enterica serovar Chester]